MPAPKFEDLTEEQVAEFTMNGKMRTEHKYIDQTEQVHQDGLVEDFYSEKSVNSFVKRAKMRIPHYYGVTDTWLFEALDKYSIKGKNVLVVGSTQPWYEVIAHVAGAKNVDVVEYADRPKKLLDNISYLKSEELEGCLGEYDVIISVSSLEHDGLGRYGDPLNPNADLEYMLKMRSMLTEDGKLFLSIPVGEDALVWNAHRIYGMHRLKRAFLAWEVVDSFGYQSNAKYVNTGVKAEYQPVFVLE